ncbi:MAG: hypothetical protein N2446_02955 [Elusimicrobiales bacterium]|nr:hypothetical protein [Elusimicrobiales bacterium]
MFFVDLSLYQKERKIFKIHLLKSGILLNEEDIEKVALLSEGFCGLKIKQGGVSTFYSLCGKLNSEIIISEITKTTPLSVIKKSDFDFIRSWANERALVKV